MKTLDPKRRVVVTGLGVVSSIGIGWEEFWPNLLAGKSGISKVEAFDTTDCERNIAGEIKKFKPHQFFRVDKANKMGRTSQFAVAASQLAVQDAGLNKKQLQEQRTAVCLGTTNGENDVLERVGSNYWVNKKSVNYQLDMSSIPTNVLSVNVAEYLKLAGHNYIFGTACSSGNSAIGMGFDLIRAGKADYVLAGGADSLSRITYTGFERLYAIAPEKCQPFDINRKGMIPGEGSGILVLESLESAENRKAKIYAEIVGYGLSCDGHHMTNPDANGVAKAIRKSLLASNIQPTEVDYISAHGTGTIENDVAECEAFHIVFNSHAKRIPVSSIKSMLGHTMGAASALEAIACCLTVTKNEIPPTINHEDPDPMCEIDCVPNKSRKHSVRVVLNNSQAFGGNNVCVSIKKMY